MLEDTEWMYLDFIPGRYTWNQGEERETYKMQLI